MPTEIVRTHLKSGMVVMLGGQPHDVLRVNDCSAVVRPRKPVTRTLVTLDGRRVSFRVRCGAFRIDPNADVEIL